MDILVLGAGIMGVCIAETLRRAGEKITLIDQVFPGNKNQTSYGNAGIIARSAIVPVASPGIITKLPLLLLSPSSPLYIKIQYLPSLLPWLYRFLSNSSISKVTDIACSLDFLINDALEQHISLSEGTSAERYIGVGDWMHYYRNRRALQKDSFAMNLRKENNIKYKILEGNSLWEKEPFLSKEYELAVSYKKHGQISNPGAYVSSLADHFFKNGGRFLSGQVKTVKGNKVIFSNRKPVFGKKIVIACGAWSGKVLRDYRVKVPLEAERGYHLHLKDPSFMPSGPRLLAANKFGISPMEGGLRVAGLVEFGGLKIGPSENPYIYLKRHINKVYPSLTWSSETRWMGHRPTLSDSLPVLGALKENPSVVCAFGGQHVGLTMAPKVGKIIADIISEKKVNYDLQPFKPDRF